MARSIIQLLTNCVRREYVKVNTSENAFDGLIRRFLDNVWLYHGCCQSLLHAFAQLQFCFCLWGRCRWPFILHIWTWALMLQGQGGSNWALFSNLCKVQRKDRKRASGVGRNHRISQCLRGSTWHDRSSRQQSATNPWVNAKTSLYINHGVYHRQHGKVATHRDNAFGKGINDPCHWRWKAPVCATWSWIWRPSIEKHCAQETWWSIRILFKFRYTL